VRRLGLSQETEALVRSAPVRSHGTGGDATSVGMLVVENVVPGSPADGVLEPGDVLVQVGSARGL
jgi:S1-C subfamily serine protease